MDSAFVVDKISASAFLNNSGKVEKILSKSYSNLIARSNQLSYMIALIETRFDLSLAWGFRAAF